MRHPEQSVGGRFGDRWVITRRVGLIALAYLWAIGLMFGPLGHTHHRFGPESPVYCPAVPDAATPGHIPGSVPDGTDDGACCIASGGTALLLPRPDPVTTSRPADARPAFWPPEVDGLPLGFPPAAFASPRAPPAFA
jgi:hypothetical protein